MWRSHGARERTLADDVAEARAELAAAEALFNLADQPILIDHAIYRMAAAERRLVFLLLSDRPADAPAVADEPQAHAGRDRRDAPEEPDTRDRRDGCVEPEASDG